MSESSARVAETTAARPVRVLLIAEAANPEWVSVPLVGWSCAAALREVADVHVVTHVRNRDALCRAGWIEGTDFTAIDSEAVAGPLYRLASLLRGGRGKGWSTMTAFAAIAYYYFEHLVWRRFGRDLRAGRYDVVHRLTPLSPAVPSLIARRCRRVSVPFVVGPLNGGVPWPAAFRREQHREREWLSAFRNLSRLLPGARSMRREASAIIAGSTTMLDDLTAEQRTRAYFVPENAVDAARFTEIRTRRASSPVHAVFVGRLVPLKGVDMLLEAAAPLVRAGRLTVDLVGDGPERGPLALLADRENIAGGVTFSGWVDHADVQRHLASADLFAFPSIKEFGGGAVLEAMAVGLPALVMNYGGPADLVDDETGYRIDMGTRSEIVGRLRETLGAIVDDPAGLDRRGQVARERVWRDFTWPAKARRLLEIYRSVLPERDETSHRARFAPSVDECAMVEAA
ncbi:MAG: glycosyltransferase [Phycisphaerales bacterium]|nr:glycosyltransferase [Phycisphaerales bacterium]